MLNTIRDPNIAAGFQALAAAFLPNAGGAIEADMNRKRADGIVADTNRTNVDATRLAADRARLETETARTQGYINADQSIAAILSAPGFDPADPRWRQKLAAAAAGTQNGLEKGPAGVTGFSTFVQPQFAGSAEDFSNILLGTGIIADAANTPQGFATREANDLTENVNNNTRAVDVADIQRDGAMDRTVYSEGAADGRNTFTTTVQSGDAEAKRILDADTQTKVAQMAAEAAMRELKYKTTTPLVPGAAGAGGGSTLAPLTVEPATVQKFTEALTGRLDAQYPGADVPPELASQLLTEALTLYQTNRNADASIAQVLSGLTTQTADGWFGDSTTVARGTPLPSAPAPAPAAGAAPAAAAAAPLTATGPKGEKVMWDAASGAWVPLGPVASP